MMEDVCRCIILPFTEGERDEDVIVAEDQYLLQSDVFAVQDCSVGESVETLTLFWKEVGELMLQDYLGYDPKK